MLAGVPKSKLQETNWIQKYIGSGPSTTILWSLTSSKVEKVDLFGTVLSSCLGQMEQEFSIKAIKSMRNVQVERMRGLWTTPKTGAYSITMISKIPVVTHKFVCQD